MLRSTRDCNRGGALLAGFVTVVLAGGSVSVVAAAERPFILWNKQDAAALRQKIETQPWAQAAYKRVVEEPDRNERDLADLFRYTVMGEQEPADQQKKELMKMVRSPFPQGAAQYINVLRYDQLYDRLTPAQRREVEDCFRNYIEQIVFRRAIFDKSVFNDSRNYSRYDARTYSRSNWLPNITWPWKVSANLMALALADEKLIRKTWAAYGSWQWYFDEYLADVGFYGEEFGKMGSTPGAMLLYCRGVERLGLGQLGYGYQGKAGATMRGHIESLIHLAYPRVDVGSNRPHYPMVTIGDMRQSGSSQSWNLPSLAFQHSLVRGYTPDGNGGNERWKAHGAWGGVIRGDHAQWDGYSNFTPKMQVAFWFEIGHRRWPEAGFAYFLAQMRSPEQDKYYPSVFFGLDPIDPAGVEPPRAPSAVWPRRGLVMLRADESPGYWQSQSPAVCMRLAANYAHNVNDSFSLAGFYAMGRPIYLNRQTYRGYAQGFSRSIQSHCGLVVDGAEPRFTDETTVRHAFGPLVKFAAARSTKVYDDTDLTRALFLTREYLLDVSCLAAPKPRRYHWLVHTIGLPKNLVPSGWKTADKIDGLSPQFHKVRSVSADDATWLVTVVQDCALKQPDLAKLGPAWYAKRVGVRMTMLAAPGTTAYVAATPELEPVPRKPDPGPNEVGGVSIVAARTCSRTAFVALHEPFQGGSPQITDFRRIQQDQRGLAVAVVGRSGSGVNDRVMMRYTADADKPITLAGDGESFTFADHLYVRIGNDTVEVSGGLKAMKVRVRGRPKLVVNGKEQKATIADGLMTFAE